MAAQTPALSSRPSPGHRRSNSASTASISASIASSEPVPSSTSGAIASTDAAAAAAAAAMSKTPAKAKAVVKRRNSLSAGAIVSKEARVLADVCAMVDVRVGQDAQIDCSGVVADKMAELGAVIVKRFTPRLTHIVLSHLTPAWKDKIAKWTSNISVSLARRVDGRPEIQIVSQLWVNACYVSKTRMAEKPFFPVSKAAAGIDGGHLHLNGAMKQFVAAHPTPAPVPAPTPAPATVSADNTPASATSRAAFRAAGSSRISATDNSSSDNASTSGASAVSARATAAAVPNRRMTLDAKSMSAIASARRPAATANGNTSTTSTGTTTSAKQSAAAASSRRMTLDAKGVSAIANARKPAATGAAATGAANRSTATAATAMPTTRHAAIQFQFGAAAALAAATLGSQATKRKRRALSMEPMASDAIQKMLATPSAGDDNGNSSSSAMVTPRKEDSVETPGGGAKKKLDLDAILTPVSIEATSKRRPMSSAKRRKTMSELPSETLTMPVIHTPMKAAATMAVAEEAEVEADPNPQKKLFQDTTPSSDCVAESQSDPEDEEECKPPAASVDASSSVCETADAPAEMADDPATEIASAAPVAAAAVSSETTSAPTETATTELAVFTAAVVATEAPSTEPSTSSTFSIGVPDRQMRSMRTRAGSSATLKPSAVVVVAAAPSAWKCNACGASNTRARRLCKNCRTSKTAALAVAAKAAVAPRTRATRRFVVAPAPAPAPAPASAPGPKTPLAPPREKNETNPTSPKASTATGLSSRRVLTTPKTITKPALSAASKRQQRTAPAATSTAPGTSSKPTAAARKLPLAPPRTPSKPPSHASVATPKRQTQGSTSHQPPKTPAGRSVSVLEMTPVRVTEGAGNKRSLSTSTSSTSTNASTRLTKNPRLSGTSAVSDNDRSFDEKVGIDQLERITTPQRLSSSTRRSTASFGNTPVKTPAEKKNAPAARRARSVIGITGVDLETRGVIECAVHAIDASMVAEPGYRKARVVKSVDYSAAVTHLIVGEDTKRTIKVLFAIARGAWIVSEAWVFSSLEQEQWLPEDEYELTIHANKFARMNPEARQIFRGMKFFVGSNVEPSREVVQSLLQSAGGEVCNQISVADMCVCGDGSLFRRAQRTGVRVVTAKWVFDSIGAMKLEADHKYGLATFDQDE